MKIQGYRSRLIVSALLGFCAAATGAQEKVLYNFSSGEGGTTSLIFDAAGNLYGTNPRGGTGQGSVFELSPASNGAWTENDIFSFGGAATDPALPFGDLAIDAKGNLYGTTELEAGGGWGTVYKLSRPQVKELPKWTQTALYQFGLYATDGQYPIAGPTFDSKGNLYGTTNSGGADSGFGSVGTVFELSPSADGNWTEKVLYSFGPSGQIDGSSPFGGLVVDGQGNLFGTTTYGGANSSGTVFELSPEADGSWTPRVLYNFPAFNTNPFIVPAANLTLDGKGNVFGTFPDRGDYGHGFAFELSPAAGGSWTEKTLYSFGGTPEDGAGTQSTLLMDAHGSLVGSTGQGGAYGGGTVFRLTPAADGTWTEQVVHSFGGANPDGSFPGSLAMDAKGNLFGTTFAGGEFGNGTFFEIPASLPTLTVAAASATIMYGEPVPQFSYTLAGFVNGDTAETATTGTPHVSATVTGVPQAGYYHVIVAPGTLTAPNYRIEYNYGYLAVQKATLHVTAQRATKVYGAPLPALGYSISGFVNGDTAATAVTGSPILSTTATATSRVGSYPIVLLPGSLSAKNYRFVGAGSGMDVTNAPLTIKANDLTMTQGSAVPQLTCTMSGFVNGDTRSTATAGKPAMTTTATSNSAPGDYPISIGWGSLGLDNYSVTFANGTLHVIAPQKVHAHPVPVRGTRR